MGAHTPHDSPTRQPGPGDSTEPMFAPGHPPGASIGPYRLLSIVGEGGFGEVWLAERRAPFIQRVALKIIKPGMDSRAVVARFEQERQALAVMDHPNVARVLDGGITSPEMGSRPYFVMEYVKGEPITAFCDRHRLTIRQRLELFIPVCEAVQHAHHKGIIHRDIKPSNVLVETVDNRLLPKVIDFGVAKAISNALTGKTVFTERGQIVGTPEYMSPEQAEMTAASVDTRTDVYSLGVLLYELLAGVLPFDPRILRAKGYAEIQRIIREEEAPKPSTRLSTIDEQTVTAIVGKRHSSRDELSRTLRRELEWIPLLALRKEPDRRYRTPIDMAKDIRRYLIGQPLEAGPETAGYRIRKFFRRHRGPIAAAMALLFLLVAGTLVSSYGFLAARRDRDAAIEAAKRERTASEEAKIESARARAFAQVMTAFVVDLASSDVLDDSLQRLFLLDDFRARLDQAGELMAGEDRLVLYHLVALAYLDAGLPNAAQECLFPAWGFRWTDPIMGYRARCLLEWDTALIMWAIGNREEAREAHASCLDSLSRLPAEEAAPIKAVIDHNSLMLAEPPTSPQAGVRDRPATTPWHPLIPPDARLVCSISTVPIPQTLLTPKPGTASASLAARKQMEEMGIFTSPGMNLPAKLVNSILACSSRLLDQREELQGFLAREADAWFEEHKDLFDPKSFSQRLLRPGIAPSMRECINNVRSAFFDIECLPLGTRSRRDSKRAFVHPFLPPDLSSSQLVQAFDSIADLGPIPSRGETEQERAALAQWGRSLDRALAAHPDRGMLWRMKALLGGDLEAAARAVALHRPLGTAIVRQDLAILAAAQARCDDLESCRHTLSLLRRCIPIAPSERRLILDAFVRSYEDRHRDDPDEETTYLTYAAEVLMRNGLFSAIKWNVPWTDDVSSDEPGVSVLVEKWIEAERQCQTGPLPRPKNTYETLGGVWGIEALLVTLLWDLEPDEGFERLTFDLLGVSKFEDIPDPGDDFRGPYTDERLRRKTAIARAIAEHFCRLFGDALAQRIYLRRCQAHVTSTEALKRGLKYLAATSVDSRVPGGVRRLLDLLLADIERLPPETAVPPVVAPSSGGR